MHVHAVSGAAWMLLGYGTLLSTWAAELLSPDYVGALTTTFGEANFPVIALTALVGVTLGATGFPMRPKRRFRAYAEQMRNSMTSVALLSFVTATFVLDGTGGGALGDGAVAAGLSDATRAVVGLGAAYMGREAVISRKPWDIAPTVADLQLERPPEFALYAARAISLGWLAMVAAATSHVLVDSPGNAVSAAFAAQMALSLAMAPASEALVGTLVMKERFTKDEGSQVLLTKTPSGGLRVAHWLDATILALNVPGPAVLSLLVALHAGHADLVREFLYLQ